MKETARGELVRNVIVVERHRHRERTALAPGSVPCSVYGVYGASTVRRGTSEIGRETQVEESSRTVLAVVRGSEVRWPRRCSLSRGSFTLARVLARVREKRKRERERERVYVYVCVGACVTCVYGDDTTTTTTTARRRRSVYCSGARCATLANQRRAYPRIAGI